MEYRIAAIDDFCIRDFKTFDLDAVKSLIYRTIDACYCNVYPKEAVAFFNDHHRDNNILKDAQEGHTIVLEIGNQIIGTGTIMGDEIKRVFVDPAFQKRGYGKVIMRHLEAKASANEISIIKLDSSLPAKKFYDSLGYITLEKTFKQVENGKKLDYYKMEKSYGISHSNDR